MRHGGEGGGETKRKNKNHVPAAPGWAPTTASSIPSHLSYTLLLLLQGGVRQPWGQGHWEGHRLECCKSTGCSVTGYEKVRLGGTSSRQACLHSHTSP